ncbi:MAG: helix-turn-helix domain-containing protein [Caldilinea sp.]
MKTERGKNVRGNVQVAGPVIGSILRERREAMGVTLAEAEVATRIRQKYLAALESDEWDLLPGEVVGRGFLRNYSTYLGIEPNEMIERRRAIADESLATVLADTSAGSPLPPERPVDYRPKDVALHEETDELESPRRINLIPAALTLLVVALAVLIWWTVTQFGDSIASGVAEAQRQVVAWQQSLTASPTSAATPPRSDAPSLPENLVAPQPASNETSTEATQPIVSETAPSDANLAAPAVPLVIEQPTPAPVEQPIVEEAPTAVSLLTVLPTPTPQPEAPVQPTTPATVITAANLRQGPSTDFPVVGGAAEGQEIVIVGRIADGAWYQLENGAWIFAQLVQNPPTDIPVVEAPPAP